MRSLSLSIVLVSCALLACTPLAKPCGNTYLDVDFNKYTGGYKTWSKTEARRYMPKALVASSGFTRAFVGNKCLMVEHPKGVVGVKNGGFILHAPLSKDLDEATLSYRFKFEKGYDWTYGGKCVSLP